MTKESKERNLRSLRFGLTAVVPITFIVSLGVFLAASGALVLSLIASLIVLLVTFILSMFVYYGYKMILDRIG